MGPPSVPAWLLAAALVLPTSVHGGEPSWVARYQVRFGLTDAGVPRADVEATLRWIGKAGEKPSWLEVGMAEDGFPQGYGAFVRAFEAAVPARTRRPRTPYRAEMLSTPNGRYRLPVLPGGFVGFSYSVVLEHDPKGWGPGPDEAPYRFDEGVVWTGRALFVTAPGSRAKVTFAAPAWDRVLTSFEPAARGRPKAFSVPDEERLRDSFLVVGRPASVDLKVGDATVTLALGGTLKESLPMLSTALGRFLTASGALFGGAPPRRILAVGNVGAPKGSFHGGTFGPDVSFLVDEPLDLRNASRWRPFLCHEVFHLWNGHALDYEGQEYWMSEGFTDYYAWLLLVRLGDLSSDHFLAELQGRMSRYLERPAEVGLHAAGEVKFDNAALVYGGGSLAALCLDLQIRAATSNRKSLDEVMRSLYAEFAGDPRKKVATADVMRVMSSTAGKPFGEFFARYVTGHETLPLSESLELAGIRVAPVIRDLPETKWIAANLLRCRSMTAHPQGGIKVLKSEGEPLREGDVISEVAGAPVKTFDDLRMAFGDLTPGATVTVTVRREGKPVPLQVKLGGDPSSPTPRSRFVSVSASVVTTLDERTLAIRKAIFGPGLTSIGTTR